MHNITYDEVRLKLSLLFRKMPVMTERQFMVTLKNITGLQGAELKGLVAKLEANGDILTSGNGYVAAKYTAEAVSTGALDIKFEGRRRISHLEPKQFFRECIDCYSVILGFHPASENFTVSTGLYRMGFCHQGRNLFYELVRIPRDLEMSYAPMILRDAAGCFSNPHAAEMREHTRRIALVESEAVCDYVPYCGFSFICVSHPPGTPGKGYEVVQKRTEDIWRDCPSP